MSLFVVEVHIPTTGYMPVLDRHPLIDPERFGVQRGYWKIGLRPDEAGNHRPEGVDAVLELNADSAEQAEDNALDVGLKLSAFFAVHLGSALTIPQLLRLAELTTDEKMIEQRNYYYDLEFGLRSAAQISPSDFDTFVGRIVNDTPKVRDALELAIRWYGLSVGAEDILDSYLAAWIGLEALGPLLNDHFHIKGVKVRCKVCRNRPGEGRNRTHAGLEHLMRLRVPELLANQTYPDLANRRNDIAHPSRVAGRKRDMTEVRRDIDDQFQDIMLCILAAILILTNPAGEQVGNVPVKLPRASKTQPSAMAWIRSHTAFAGYQPLLGKWADVVRNLTDATSTILDSGEYRPEYRIEILTPMADIELDRGYVVFTRGQTLIDINQGSLPVHRSWRPRPLTDAWQRLLVGSQV